MLFAHFTFFSFLSPTHLHADFGTCCYNASLICLCCRCLCCHSFNLASTPPLSHFIIYTTADNGDCYRTFFHSSLFQPNNYRKHAEVFTAKKALLLCRAYNFRLRWMSFQPIYGLLQRMSFTSRSSSGPFGNIIFSLFSYTST